jgi:LEA14-like dessication related protein
MTSCFKIKELQVKEVQSVKVLNMTSTEADLAVTLKVFNPNNMKIIVKSIDLDAYVNKKLVGKVKTDKKIIIPKNSEKSYIIIVKADMKEVNKLLPGMIFASHALVNLQGEMKVKAKGISKKICVNIDEKVSRKEIQDVMMTGF